MSLPPWSSCSNLSAHSSCSKLLLKGRRRRPSPTHLHNHHHHCKQPTGHNPAEKSNFTPTHKITPRPRIGLLAGAPMVDFLPASWAGSRHSLLTLLLLWLGGRSRVDCHPSRATGRAATTATTLHPQILDTFLPLGHPVQKGLRSVSLLSYLHFLSLFALSLCILILCFFRLFFGVMKFQS